MSTIYTLNSKVLKNIANDKWLIKKPAPAEEVQIGNQIWKNKNLSIDDGQGGIYTRTVNYGQGNVIEYFYTWEAAVRIAATISGWHLPTTNDWDTLAATVGGSYTGGTKLKSTYGWKNNGNGTDDFGFAVFPAGYRDDWSYFYDLFSKAYFWTAAEYESSKAYSRRFITGTSIDSDINNKSYGFSVRLIKD